MTPVFRHPLRAAAVAVLLLVGATVPVLTWATAEAATDPCGTTVSKAGGGTWTCTFADTFSSTALDSTKWNVQDTKISGFQLNNTCFKGGNVVQSGGTVKLKVTKAPAEFDCQAPYGTFKSQYVGADINGWGKFSQTYGRFEVRMKLPAYGGAGYHGGFWMNPQGQPYGAWPASGEIDVAEWFSKWPDHTYPTLHYNGSTSADTGMDCFVGKWAAWHVYTVEWSAEKIDVFVDGARCYTNTWTPESPQARPQPFDKPFYFSLTAAAGGMVNAPTSSTPYPATFEIDYVKAWK